MNLRLRFFYRLLRPLVVVFLKIKFGYTYKTAKSLPSNYVVLSNHLTDFDPLFVGASFKRQMYFVASEHIARWGWIYKLLKFIFEPIIRYKGAAGSAAVIEMMRRVKKGGSVCMFAEGVRSWDGATGEILPSTAAVIKRGDCALVTYKLSGAYFVSPMWSGASTRRGPVSGEVVNVYTKEKLAKMSVTEIADAINKDLYENAYEKQLANPKPYRGKRIAEKLENLMFICPHCGEMDSITTSDNKITCTACRKEMTLNEYGFLEGSKFKTLKEISDWQKKNVLKDVENRKSYVLRDAKLSTVDTRHEETQLAKG
ncbi:MAG: 1-acyl-sn-glycerol-3-phosphate acyltransferase, partial [Clostridia bacterium]|nr:1-acyl-sn-glycerol-3-phosphate acyltransferase [Clostridia bacterium]